MSFNQSAERLPEKESILDRFPELASLPQDFLLMVHEGKNLVDQLTQGEAPEWVIEFADLPAKEVGESRLSFLHEMLNAAKNRMAVEEALKIYEVVEEEE